MTDSVDWRVRKGPSIARFSDRLVVQGMRRGMLDLSVCVLAGGDTRPGSFGLLSPLAAACASEGIRRDTGVVSWLHWPDLVTVDGRVVAKTSLSVSASPKPDGNAQIIFDISVNCFALGSGDFPSELPSTSLLKVLGVEVDVDLLRDKILHALNWYSAEWERGVNRKLAERMEPTIAWLGHSVEVRTVGGPTLRGIARGMDDLGSLLLERQGGKAPRTFAVPPASVELVKAVN